MRTKDLVAGAKRLISRGDAAGVPGEDDPCVVALRAAIGADKVRIDGAGRFLASRDASIYEGGDAGPICYPTCAEDIVAAVRVAAEFERAIVPRGAGTGLAGGTVPLGNPIVISTKKMERIIEVDIANRIAWVEPGVINLDLTRHLHPMGFHFAPDPSSQQICTIGGNVANNSGGPHCLAYGVTSSHVVAIDVVTADGALVRLGGLEADSTGYDLRGAFVGSEGMLGIATRVAVRITPNPPAVRTMLLSFADVGACAATVGAIIADGMVPAAIEMMDKNCVVAVEGFVGAGYPLDAAAVLLVEVDGLDGGVAEQAARVEELGISNGATAVRTAADDTERALLWKGRKSAFGAIANIKPDYYLHDTVVPRNALVPVMHAIYEIVERHELIVLNVFHAGDGNLHPLIVYDAREPGIMARVHEAGREIVEVSLAHGGVLSGEHGIGVEKRDYMGLLFTDDDLDQQARLRSAFDPHCRSNPGKVLPSSHSCADIASLSRPPAGVWG